LTEAILVIDARDHGLPHAPKYYQTFPQEPSPLGLLTFTAQKTTAMSGDSSLFTALPELGKAGAGGAAVVVCHAYASGMLLPIAPGGAHQFADKQGLDVIDKAIKAEADHARILALPRTTDVQRTAALGQWRTFLVGLGADIGEVFSEAEAETAYSNWFGKTVVSALEFKDASTVRTLLARVLAVRQAKLARIELRACNVGGDRTTMEMLRKFFGCDAMTAPTVGTFYAVVQVGPLVQVFSRRGTHGTSTSPRPISLRDTLNSLSGVDLRDAIISARLMKELDSTRGFLRVLIVTVEKGPVLGRNTGIRFGELEIEGDTFRFLLRVKQKPNEEFEYDLNAWATGSAGAAAPAPDIIRLFAAGSFDPNTLFRGEPVVVQTGRGPRNVLHALSMPVAGLWTPGTPNQPFVLPLESAYLPLIAKSP